jgi:hypothetical protein
MSYVLAKCSFVFVNIGMRIMPRNLTIRIKAGGGRNYPPLN